MSLPSIEAHMCPDLYTQFLVCKVGPSPRRRLPYHHSPRNCMFLLGPKALAHALCQYPSVSSQALGTVPLVCTTESQPGPLSPVLLTSFPQVWISTIDPALTLLPHALPLSLASGTSTGALARQANLLLASGA